MFGIVIFVHIGVFLYKHIHYSYNFLNVTILRLHSVSVRIRLQSCNHRMIVQNVKIVVDIVEILRMKVFLCMMLSALVIKLITCYNKHYRYCINKSLFFSYYLESRNLIIISQMRLNIGIIILRAT